MNLYQNAQYELLDINKIVITRDIYELAKTILNENHDGQRYISECSDSFPVNLSTYEKTRESCWDQQDMSPICLNKHNEIIRGRYMYLIYLVKGLQEVPVKYT